MTTHPALQAGRVAVITGGASGIGFAAARHFAGLGMKVCIADLDESALSDASKVLAGDTANGSEDVLAIALNVSSLAAVESLRDQVLARFGEVAVLMNNAGTGPGGGPWSNYDGWQHVLGVNLWGIINGVQTFTQLMIDQGTPCALVNTGSKQGITNPPGDAAYNVSKAGVKALTEAVAHGLRNVENCQVSAHLLVPGFTYTGMIRRHVKEKPPAAWDPEQVVEELVRRMGDGDFYIICPDNDVSTALDNARIRWNTEDITANRPALSRWHPDYQGAFNSFIEEATDSASSEAT